MNDEKKIKDKENKSLVPDGNKTNVPEAPKASEVKIKFRPNRAAEGVYADADGVATVSKELAQYLVSIGYADEVK